MSNQNAKDLTEDDAFLKAKSDALRLLSIRPRSVAEMTERLKRKHYPKEIIEKLIGVFQAQGLLNDDQFAKLFANARVHSNPQGRKKLAVELAKKGLAPTLIEKTVAGLKDVDEESMAMELARRRFEHMAGLSSEKKKFRLYGLLKRRGFDDGVVFGVIQKLMKDKPQS